MSEAVIEGRPLKQFSPYIYKLRKWLSMTPIVWELTLADGLIVTLTVGGMSQIRRR